VAGPERTNAIRPAVAHAASATPSTAPASREHGGLNQQLPHETPPRGADGKTDGKFAVPGFSPRQQQVGHVRARDQQHHAD
jgi:hypothetical protein